MVAKSTVASLLKKKRYFVMDRHDGDDCFCICTAHEEPISRACNDVYGTHPKSQDTELKHSTTITTVLKDLFSNFIPASRCEAGKYQTSSNRV